MNNDSFDRDIDADLKLAQEIGRFSLGYHDPETNETEVWQDTGHPSYDGDNHQFNCSNDKAKQIVAVVEAFPAYVREVQRLKSIMENAVKLLQPQPKVKSLEISEARPGDFVVVQFNGGRKEVALVGNPPFRGKHLLCGFGSICRDTGVLEKISPTDEDGVFVGLYPPHRVWDFIRSIGITHGG